MLVTERKEMTREGVQRAAAMGAVEGSQPSSGVVLPSSHCSPDSILPSPQTGGWHRPFTHRPAQEADVVVVIKSGPHVVGVSFGPQKVKPGDLPMQAATMAWQVPSRSSQFCVAAQAPPAATTHSPAAQVTGSFMFAPLQAIAPGVSQGQSSLSAPAPQALDGARSVPPSGGAGYVEGCVGLPSSVGPIPRRS